MIRALQNDLQTDGGITDAWYLHNTSLFLLPHPHEQPHVNLFFFARPLAMFADAFSLSPSPSWRKRSVSSRASLTHWCTIATRRPIARPELRVQRVLSICRWHGTNRNASSPVYFYDAGFYSTPAILQDDSTALSASSIFFSFLFSFFGKSIGASTTPSLLIARRLIGLSARRPHFEYRTLAHGRWVGRRLSIHSIRFNSFNCVKHGRVEYFLYFRTARPQRWRRREVRNSDCSGKIDTGSNDNCLARNVTSFRESPIL